MPADGGAGRGDSGVQSTSIWETDGNHEREEDDSALIQAARIDPAAFGLVYQRYRHRIYAYLRTRAGSAEDAADLTQLVFLRALDGLPRYRGGGKELGPWLFRIARNAATDFQRRRRPALTWDHLPAALEPQSEQDPEGAVLRSEEISRLRPLVLALGQGTQELLALRFAAGLTAGEIAVVLGKSEAAVRKQLARTIQRLKEQYYESP
jgi:RNA polymerase sigma-70 factor (ECF subfamily)